MELYHAFCIVLLIGLFSCKDGKDSKSISETNQSATEKTSGNSSESEGEFVFSLAGTYSGTLPCADCEGIEANLTLNEDYSYKMTSEYIGKDDKIFTEDGTFLKEKRTIILKSSKDDANSANQFMLIKDGLVKLDKDGNRIEGDLAEKYQLRLEE